jgi:hypothetical protein
MLGQHEVLLRLASGGAANVFLVRDTKAASPGRLLALKVLLPSLAANDDFLNMFFTEARIAARLNHPNIVAITGFGQAEGIHCLAMEYVFGASLAQVLRASAKARKPLTVGVLLRITAQVCDALQYAHELKDEQNRPMGLVHRDVTPQNILIGFNGVPKLTDFGIAKATNRGWETQAGIVKGKFSYMSPEQALGRKVDRRSDIFCTGIVLWEALTGKELFKGTSPMEVIEAIREQPIVPPSKVVPGLSPIVDPIVMKALRRSPRGRYQSAIEMKNEIEDLIDRAGVKIDAQTIAKEFAEVFGDTIVERAFALRSAMAGRAELEELARVLGGSRLREDHLPVIPGGASHPDPLGLFGEMPAFEEEAPLLNAASDGGLAIPARAEGFTTGALSIQIEVEDPVDEDDHRADDEEEDEEPDLAFDDYSEHSASGVVIEGWEDATRMTAPPQDLLAMLSEQDATRGLLAERFGPRPSTGDLDRGEDTGGGFGEEHTVDTAERSGNIWDPPSIRRSVPPVADEFDHSPPTKPDQDAILLRGVSPKKIEPAQTVLDPRLVKHRPVPRAPSLDMMGDAATPLPDLEFGDESSSVKPSLGLPPPPPPPPARKLSGARLSEPQNDPTTPIMHPGYADDLLPVAPVPIEDPEEEAPSNAGSMPGAPVMRPQSNPHSPAIAAIADSSTDPLAALSSVKPGELSPAALRELAVEAGSSNRRTLPADPSTIRLKPVGLMALALVFIVLGVGIGILIVKLIL